MLLYGLVAFPLNKSQLLSIDFVINRFFIKLFSTSNMGVVKCCQEQFSFELPSGQSLSVSQLYHKNCYVYVTYLCSPFFYCFTYRLVYFCVYLS